MTLPIDDLALPRHPGDRQHWYNLPGAALPLAAAGAAIRHPGLSLLVVQDSSAAIQLSEELRFFLGDALPVLHFPDWETLPFDAFSPHEDITSERIQTLYQLPRTERGLLVVPITTLMHRLPPVRYISASSLVVKRGDRLELTALRRDLEAAGYRSVETVYEHGEFAVRGAILDLFPMGSEHAYRIEFFDDEVESLRSFDVETQRTIEQSENIRLLPAREVPLNKGGISEFRNRWSEFFEADPRRCPPYKDVCAGIPSPGIEYYLPLFFDDCATLFNYLPPNTLVLGQQGLDRAAEHFWKEVCERFEERQIDQQRPPVPPASMFLTADAALGHLKAYPRIELVPGGAEERSGWHDAGASPLPAFAVDPRSERPMATVAGFVSAMRQRVLFTAESAGRREALSDTLARSGIQTQPVSGWQDFATGSAAVGICVAPLAQGFHHAGAAIAVIAEPQLFGERVMQRRRRRKAQDQAAENAIKHLSELKPGGAVVHIEHGIGRYVGLQVLEIDGQDAEFLTLEYADQAKLYVPVSSLHMISRYSGADDEHAPLHRLGSDQWQKARQKAAEKVRDVAAELLDLYARRAARKGSSQPCREDALAAFAAGFPFEETADQEAAIQAVIEDMAKPQPMDRLVCGDVGFGKTEVAMRAAFIAVQNGAQVCVLVPTTLLAQQHYESFKDRFADWPVGIEVLSRFRSAKEQKEALDRLAEGKIDIMVGTHRLLQKDVRYRNLGLVIIDEEHRFGVQQKDQLKALRAEVDVLTLTATPIPRTLNMAFSGLRDLSLIATAPARRLSIKTFVRPRQNSLIKEAILREILRGGQVYFLHNDVATIEKTAAEIGALIPEARVGIGHGQMRERELERVMSDFYHKRFNVLVCTTIIETGIDVPSANTIIIERADKFGLAQLHQLRGRVGRSHHQAYAYLLTPEHKRLTPDAEKRLEAIEAAQDLGAGFVLATHDLEIRGAGEFLGAEQSGQIQGVGFSLYMDMLERAVKAIKSGKTPDLGDTLNTGVDVNLRIPALIPEDYLPDVQTRLILYKRIASASGDEMLRELEVEMIDRFGLLPEQVRNLFRVTRLKIRAERLGAVKLEAGPASGRIEFGQEPALDPMSIVRMVQAEPRRYQIERGTTLRFQADMASPERRLQAVEQLLARLSPEDTP